MKDWKIIEDEEAKVRIRTGVVMLCRHLRSRSATLAPALCAEILLHLSPYKDCL